MYNVWICESGLTHNNARQVSSHDDLGEALKAARAITDEGASIERAKALRMLERGHRVTVGRTLAPNSAGGVDVVDTVYITR